MDSNKKAFGMTVVILFLLLVGVVAFILYGPKGERIPVQQQTGNEEATSTPIKEIPFATEKVEGKYYTVDISYPSSDDLYQIKQYVEETENIIFRSPQKLSAPLLLQPISSKPINSPEAPMAVLTRLRLRMTKTTNSLR